jgi:outer membrane protein, heavy metal efflux system
MHSLLPRAVALAAALLPKLAMAAPLTLEQALEHSVQRSEAARAARAGVTSASQAAHAAGQLPDPMLGVSVENLPITGADRLHTGREGMTMKRIALSQEWVPREKRTLRTAAATAMVAREAASAAVAAADTRLQTAVAYIDAYYASAALKLGLDNERRAREASQTARARLSGGAGAAQEVLALASAQGMAMDETAELRQQAASASVHLTRWTGLSAEELSAPVLTASVPEQGFVDSHPDVLARRRQLEVARQEASLTGASRRPNWTWEVAYAQRAGFSDMVSVGVTVPLPVAPAARQDRETASKLALAEKAEAEAAEAIRAAQAEYRTLTGDATRLQERITAFERGVVAPARQRTAAATAAYGSNQANLAMVFEARQAEIEAERRLLNLRRDLARVQAQLNFKPVRAEELQ